MGVAKGWRRDGWGSRGDCRLPGGLEELHAAPLREGGAAAGTAFPPLSRWGRKERVGVGMGAGGCHLFSLSVPSSFSQPVCGSLWRLLLPSAVDPEENLTD